MPEYTFAPILYNQALYEATRTGETSFMPVITTDIRILLKWVDRNNNNVGYMRIYPNPSGNIEIEQAEDPQGLLYDDALYNFFVTKEGKPTRNFLQQINIERIKGDGGNNVTMTFFDPQGRLLDESFFDVYRNYLQNADKASVHMSMVYGWANTDLKKYGASLGDDLMLLGITVDAEYWGASYTLKFVDSMSTTFNRTINCWQQAPPDPGAQGTTSGSEEQKLIFPQALIEAWKLMIKSGGGTFGSRGKYYIVTATDDKTFLPQAVYEGDRTTWKGKEKSYADWNPGTQNFEPWILDNLKNDYPEDGNIKATFKQIHSGSKILGDPTNWSCYDGTMWKPVAGTWSSDELFVETISGKTTFKVPKNALFCAIVCDTTENLANSKAPPGRNEILKYYLYATPVRSPHATVINFKIGSDNVFSLFMASPSRSGITKSHTPESDMPKQQAITTGSTVVASDSCSDGCKQTPKQDDPATPKATEAQETGASQQSSQNVSMFSVTANLEILGDPDLCTMIGKYVVIDFDEYSPAALPWTRGVYWVQSISEALVNGMWTHTLQIMKVSELLGEDIKFNRETGKVETPDTYSAASIPQTYAEDFLKITNYLEWLLGALGIANILGNLIGGIISDLAGIYSGILGLFTNEELANISNTIQNTMGGKNYNNPQNLGNNTSQNSTQQYYQSQMQTTKEILTNYCENFSKMDDIEDTQTRKDVALLATKFGGDMVRSQVTEMMSNNQEISLESVKEALASNKKWYRTGDKNFIENVRNFGKKPLPIPHLPQVLEPQQSLPGQSSAQ